MRKKKHISRYGSPTTPWKKLFAFEKKLHIPKPTERIFAKAKSDTSTVLYSEFKADIADLKPIVRRAVKVTPRKCNILVLPYRKIVAENDTLTVTGTDLDKWEVGTCKAVTYIEDEIVIPGYRLKKILENNKGSITIGVMYPESNEIEVRTETTNYILCGLDPSDFPKR